MTENTADRFWAWFDRYADGYKTVIKKLTNEFGSQFSVWHTGGGCMAIEGSIGDRLVMITDAGDTLSRMDERKKARKQGHPLGYGVGIYDWIPCDGRHWDSATQTLMESTGPCDDPTHREQSCEAVGWASSPEADTTKKLIRLIKIAVASVGTFDTRRPWEHIDPKLLKKGVVR